ncbi:P-loop containing nucleoside triphosphate hydrolase protein [Coniophora puteana RWD-64-598 SS2]|uniref:P-loop containing nucleoside triphosphate hydrolase protein n=1 Tax=Coniophora puteana (strain RWD-64-598) TaxID=741705 RepID=A0A5M3N0U9_CONPW|nr:P-loop containing nucleoside triphosphate hydrolase protein [Coniophora puteana RWD-64-598 SS2]EIW84644.1 P-loop containing nucleoside triphosphate hydrolase protein [Coniophora puteana RWD-64-598 SS2]
MLLAIFWTNTLSIARLAALQTASSSLQDTFESISMGLKELPTAVARVKSFYTLVDMKNELASGFTSYPPPGNKAKEGMAINIKNVSFTYKGSQASRDAITDVSLSIRAGQLVVIVGANGSGKSTLLRLLVRLYAPVSGVIELDGHPIEEYNVNDLRRAIAHLSQDHKLLPLSVAENIGVGCLEKSDDMTAIKDAAVLAGAEGLVKKFERGFETVLTPAGTAQMSFNASGNEALTAEFNKMEKSADVSGGERQRIVAARTFMRLFSDDINLVTVDEPSSALDPQGECELFQRLRNARHGRTMIFVTHRFGHLTKYADLIVCMKDGKIVETGTHDGLLKSAGEYARLYNIQASAFTS